MTKYDSLIERYLAKLSFANKSPLTIRQYKLRLLKLDEWLMKNYSVNISQEEPIKKVTGLMLEEWQMDLRETCNSSTVEHSYIAAAKSFFHWATNASIVPMNPSLALIAVKIVRKEQPHLDWENVERAMQSYESRNQLRDMCILAIGFTMGLRSSGIRNLNIEDVHENTLTYTNKGGMRVTAYMPDFVVDSVRTYIETLRYKAQPCDPLFVSERGTRMSKEALTGVCERAGKYVGQKLTPHAMRRSCLTRLAEINGIEIAQRIAHHTDVSTTQRYIYQSERNMEEVYSKMGGILTLADDEPNETDESDGGDENETEN